MDYPGIMIQIQKEASPLQYLDVRRIACDSAVPAKTNMPRTSTEL